MFFALFITTWIDKENKFHPPMVDLNGCDVNPVRKGGPR
jgi:hypothetical protein